MIVEIVQALIAFSIFAAVLLLIVAATAHRDVDLGRTAWSAGAVLLAGLAALQWIHARYLAAPREAFPEPTYVVLLFIVAPAFFIFFRGALKPRSSEHSGWLALFAPWLPVEIAIPVALEVAPVV